jgi:FkbM family methyltransferase
VLKNLDLLITCDTAIGHVAGALGVPVWLALHKVPDWRNLLSGDTSPWYPTIRLFRQTVAGDWSGAMERIAAALQEQFPDIETKEFSDYQIFTSGFNRLGQTRHGPMLYNRHDKYIGRSLERYGEYSTTETDLFKQSVRSGWTVVEAGSNIGAHTLVFSKLVGSRGSVLAFEPQRVVYQTLCANMAINAITNVHCRWEALGESPGTTLVPLVDYNVENNFAAIAVGAKEGEAVRVVALDGLNLQRCHFLKIDVAGMELAALRGARQTIEKLRPVLHVRGERSDLSPPLIEYLLSLDYKLFWQISPLFAPHNFYQNPVNEFASTVCVNILGIHASIGSDISGLKPIESPQSDWRK